MASTVERLRHLIQENIEVDGKPLNVPEDLNISLADSGVPSTDIFALGVLIAKEFNIIQVADVAALADLRNLAAFLDSQTA